jgi:teichuronic acid biosynthesis glycosyltransferase TuaG
MLAGPFRDARLATRRLGVVASERLVPRVSVLVPAYDAERHLARALRSVFAQTYDEWELIVADDGSTDATAAVAAGFGERVTVVRSPRNRGLAATRNLALDHARGELVALLDADDEWLPDYLTQQVALHDRTGAAIVCCDAYVERDGVRLPERHGDRVGRPEGPIDAAQIIRANPIFVSVLAPRSVVEAAGRFDPLLRSVEDVDLWLRIVESGGAVAYNPQPLAVYHLSGGSLSTNTLRMARSRIRVYRKALERGGLDTTARREAHRQLRLQQAVEQVELARQEGALRGAARLAVASPLLARVGVRRLLGR